MPLSTACSSCAANIVIKDELIGKALKCPKCGERITLPADQSVGATASFRTGKSTEPTASAGAAPANDLPTVPGYKVLREIARGGMGRVLLAHDVQLDRPVALKILLPGANADRFVRESKITARLPHPGIPPVHALGTLPDGSPFLAMKLIAGQTLTVEMKSADRPRLLQAFTRVCEAVGFAHSRGVIHRDLKPSNIMVGEFGEVQVMDWGLAKELTGRTDGDEPASQPPTFPSVGGNIDETTDHREPGETTDDQTRAGQVMGTPSYMAPEQARGEFTDARADVFALGGILCAILTGRAPFRGQSAAEVIQRAATADLTEARASLDACGADTELIDLTKACLAPVANDRPEDAQALAEALTAYHDAVEHRLHHAKLSAAEAKTRALEEKKRRRLAMVLAATILLAVILGGAGWLWVKADRDAHAAQVTGEIDDALTQAATLREQAIVATDGRAALALFARAREQTQRAAALAESAPVEEQLTTRLQKLQASLTADETSVDEATALYRRAFALDPKYVNERELEEAIALYRRTLVLYPRFVNAHSGLGAALRAKGQTDDAIACCRQAIALDAKDANAHLGLGAALKSKGQTDEAIASYRQAITLDPKLAPAHTGLGLALQGQGKLAEAIDCHQQALALDAKLAVAHTNLGLALAEKGQPDEALACYRQAIALDPKDARGHAHLGLALVGKRKLDEAIACCRQAIGLDPKHALAHTGLGMALAGKRQTNEAITCYRQAITLDPKLALAHTNLGVALVAKRQVDEAIVCCRQAVALEPKNANAHVGLGWSLNAKGQADEAIACCRHAIALDPKNPSAHFVLGDALLGKWKTDEAIASYRQALALDPKHVPAHANLGFSLSVRGDTDEGIRSIREAITLAPKDVDANYWMGAALIRKGADEKKDVNEVVREAGPYIEVATAIDKHRVEDLLKKWGTFTDHYRGKKADPTTPNPPKTNLAQARSQAARGDWKSAATDYTRVFATQPLKDGEHGFEYAAVLLLSGDQAGYRKVCAELLQRSGQSGIRPYHVARACTLAPDAVKDIAIAATKAANELQNSGREFWSLTEQGALAYRAGQYDESANLFDRSLLADRKPGRAVLNWLWLSLVEHRRGKPAEAQAWLDKATKWLEQYPKGIPPEEDDATGLHLHNWLEAQVLHREAAALLRLKK